MTSTRISFPERPRKMWPTFDRRLIPYAFLLPAIIVIASSIGLPILYAFGLSFFRYQWNMPTLGIEFVGLRNYLNILQDQEMVASISWTFEFTAIAVGAEFILGLVLALLMNSKRLGRIRNLLRGIFLAPMMISGIVTANMWRLIFDAEYGPANHWMSLIGVGMVHWFSEPTTARLVVILSDMWITIPFVMLVLLAGLQSIPVELLEAASIDGASPWQSFLHVTLPLLRYHIMVVLIIRTTDALRAFDLIYTLTKGGPGISTSTIMLYDYRYAFQYFQMGRASAVSFSFMLLLGLISIVYIRLLRRRAIV